MNNQPATKPNNIIQLSWDREYTIIEGDEFPEMTHKIVAINSNNRFSVILIYPLGGIEITKFMAQNTPACLDLIRKRFEKCQDLISEFGH